MADDGGKKKKKPKGKGKKKDGPAADGGDVAPPPPEETGEALPPDASAMMYTLPDLNPPPSMVAQYIKQIKGPVTEQDLTTDPRTNLPLLQPQEPYASRYANVLRGTGLNQIILHMFEQVEMCDPPGAVSAPVGPGGEDGVAPPEDQPAHTDDGVKRKIFFLTDQTIFICDPDSGEVEQCMQVDMVERVDVNPAYPTLIGIKGFAPTPEYKGTRRDFNLNFGSQEARGNVIDSFLRMFERMTDVRGPLNTNMNSDITPEQAPPDYRLHVPPMTPEEITFEVVPQRSKKHLLALLENFEKQEEEALRWVEELQKEMEEEHMKNMDVFKTQLSDLLTALETGRDTQRSNNEEIARLQRLHKIATAAHDGTDFDDRSNIKLKKQRIGELEKVVEELERRLRRRSVLRAQPMVAGNFFERDLEDEAKMDFDAPPREPSPELPPPSAMGSPHPVPRNAMETNELVEVLRGQAHQRNDEIVQLQDQVDDLEKMRHEVRKKDNVIANLKVQILAASSSGLKKIPTHLNRIEGTAGGEEQQLTDPYIPLPGESPDAEPTAREPLPPFQRQPFVKQPFVSKIPKTAEEIEVHPHTGLKLVGVPREFQRSRIDPGQGGKRPPFEDLNGAVLQVFEKCKRPGRPEADRVMIISDRHIYRCTLEGKVNKTMQVGDVRDIFIDDYCGIGFRSARRGEPDMMFILENGVDARDNVVHVICTIQQHLERARKARLEKIPPGEDMAKLLNTKGQGALRIPEVSTKKHLLQQLKRMELEQVLSHEEREKQRAQEHVEEQGRLEREHAQRQEEYAAQRERDDDYTRRALEALKVDLRHEFQDKKDQEYQRLKDEIETLERENAEKDTELTETREKWRRHRCKVPKNRPGRHKAKIPHTTGMYWIPTEPTQIECRLDVLHVQFWDNILITSHANGFLNVWDIETGENIKTLKDHTAKVCAFQYDGVELVSASYDSTIRRWNVADGSCINVVAGHRGQVTCLQFDRSLLCTGSTDTTIQVWAMDVELRNLNTLRGHKGAVECLRFERDVLVSVEWGWLFIWDLDQGLVTKALRDEHGGITCLDFSAQFLVTGGQGGLLTLWDIRTGEFETLNEHEDDITHVQIEGPYCVTSSSDCTVRMWDMMQLKSLGVFNNSYPYPTTTFQFMSNRFVAVEGKTVKIWTK